MTDSPWKDKKTYEQWKKENGRESMCDAKKGRRGTGRGTRRRNGGKRGQIPAKKHGGHWTRLTFDNEPKRSAGDIGDDMELVQL